MFMSYFLLVFIEEDCAEEIFLFIIKIYWVVGYIFFFIRNYSIYVFFGYSFKNRCVFVLKFNIYNFEY